MFIWLFHRISGIVLILLIALKVLSGYSMTGEIEWSALDALHMNKFVDITVLFLFIYHSLYGIRTLLIDMGIKKERLLFWIFTILAFILFCLSVYIIYLR